MPFYDEVTYLDLARGMHVDGLVSTLNAYVTGSNRIDNQHPLYLLLLSYFMDFTTADFPRGKLLSGIGNVVFLAFLMFVAYRRWGPTTALLTGVLFSFSRATIHLSQMILADNLFAFLFVATFVFLMGLRSRHRDWFWLGALMGLAYLAKGNGHLLLIPAAIIGFVVLKQDFLKKGFLFTMIAGFVVISAFLLIRNTLIWGNPFHNVSNKVIWLDIWPEYFFYQTTSLWPHIGFSYYFEHHQIWDALQRLSGSLFVQTKLILESWSPLPFENPARYVAGVFVAVAVVVGFWQRWRQNQRCEVMVAIGGACIILGPYSLALEPTLRFVFPLVCLLLPFAAVGFQKAFDFLPCSVARFPPRFCLVLGVVFAVANGVVFAATLYRHPPLTLFKVPGYWSQTTEWIEANIPNNKRFAIDLWSPYSAWHCCKDRRQVMPFAVSDETLGHMMRFHDIEFVLVDQIQMVSDPFQAKYGPKDEFGPTSFLGGPRLFHDSGKPSHFLIYRTTTTVSMLHAPEALSLGRPN